MGGVDSDYIAILSSIPIELAKWNLDWQAVFSCFLKEKQYEKVK